MHVEPTPPKSHRKLWIALALTGLALLVAGAVARHNHIESRWARARECADAALAAHLARPGERAPLHQTPEPGNAFDGYARAFALVPAETPAMTTETAPGDELQALLDDAEARPDLTGWMPALEALRDAARRSHANSLADVRMGYELPMLPVQAVLDLGRAACLHARNQVFAGRGGEGLPALFDAMTMAADLGTSPVLVEQMVGMAVLGYVTESALADAVLDRLTPDDLRRLAAALQTIDERIPPTVSPSDDALLCGQQLLHSEANGDGFHLSAWRAWRYGFSLRLMAAEAFLDMHEHGQQMDAASKESWPQRRQRFAAFEAQVQSGRNDFLL
ncbi:MAG: hypothetical protein RL398_820, partial [Planctomycetota bacterium]